MAPTRPAAWGSVLRSALLFTPFFLASLAIFLYVLNDTISNGATTGQVVGLVLSSSVALLLGYQAVQALRDLVASPIETEGLVERRWSRNEFFIMQNAYIFVDRTVFRIEQQQANDVAPGDTVRVMHYPHTGTVERVEVIERGARVET